MKSTIKRICIVAFIVVLISMAKWRLGRGYGHSVAYGQGFSDDADFYGIDVSSCDISLGDNDKSNDMVLDCEFWGISY